MKYVLICSISKRYTIVKLPAAFIRIRNYPPHPKLVLQSTEVLCYVLLDIGTEIINDCNTSSDVIYLTSYIAYKYCSVPSHNYIAFCAKFFTVEI
jgi:hypothetical protein